MGDEVSVVPITQSARWEDALGAGALPSQQASYAKALCGSGIQPLLGVVRSAGSRLLIPFFEREWHGTRDIATIIGLSGASLAPPSAAPLALWREYARSQGWVAGYIHFSPWMELSALDSGEDIIAGNAVVLLDLSKEDALHAASDSIRAKIKKAQKSGVDLIEDRPQLAAALQKLFPSTMQRVGASARYDFAPQTLERWALDPSSIVLGAAVGGQIEAVSICLTAKEHAEYHINASTEAGREWAAWLLSHAIRRLQRRGITALNLGGGMRKGDGLYQFKLRFGGRPAAIHAVRQIYDRHRYEELCALAGVNGQERWFPAYRGVPKQGAAAVR